MAAAADQDVARLLAAVREARHVVNFLRPGWGGSKGSAGVPADSDRRAYKVRAAIVLRRRQITTLPMGVARNAADKWELRLASEPAVVEEGRDRRTSQHRELCCDELPAAPAEEGYARARLGGCGRTPEEVAAAVEFIRTLDPRPGQRYNHSETRLIEPDVAFVKRDDVYVCRDE